MSGSKKTKTTETRNEQQGVADWLQPYMQDIAPRAQALLANPTQQYQGQLVAPFSPESESGLRGLMQYAGGGVPGLQQGYGALGRAMQGFDPGMMALMRGAYGNTNPMAGNIQAGMVSPNVMAPQVQQAFGGGMVQPSVMAGMVNPGITSRDVLAQFTPGQTTAGMGLIQSGAGANPYTGMISAPMVNSQFQPGQTTAGLDLIGRGGTANPLSDLQGGRTQASELRNIAQGVNPYLDPTFERAANRVQNQVAAAMSRAGMSGSGAQQDLLQQGLSDLATQIYGGAYEADQARRMGAASQLAGLEQSDLARGLQAAGMRADVFGQDRAAAMQAGSQLAGLQQADLARQLQAGGMGADVAQANAARLMQAQGINADLAAQDRAARMAAGQALGGFEQTDLARGLQAAGMGADVEQANAARNLQAQGMSADIAAANAARNLQAQGMNVDIQQANLARQLQAQGMSADLATQNAARIMQAQGISADIAQANAARGLQAQSMNADIFGQDMARQLQAGGMLSDAARQRNALGLQAAGMLPSMYQAGQLPFQDMLRIGSARDVMAQNILDAERQRFEQGQLLPYQDLARYQALINPLGQTFGTRNTQSQATTRESQSPLQQVLGAAMLASTLFGNPFGAAGLMGSGMGAPALLGAGTALNSLSFPLTGNIGIPAPQIRL